MNDSGREKVSQLVQHTLQGSAFSGADTSVIIYMDGLVTATANTCNPGFPSAVRLRRVFINSATNGVTIPGDWNLRLRLNRSGSDTATFTFNPTTTNDVFSGVWSPQAIIQSTDQYHLVADGTTRVFMILRIVLEVEVL